jgi:putative transcriptional regulator
MYKWKDDKGGNCHLKNNQVKMYRRSMGISQERLAIRIGATRQTIGLIEAGKYNPSMTLTVALMEALNASFIQLYPAVPHYGSYKRLGGTNV